MLRSHVLPLLLLQNIQIIFSGLTPLAWANGSLFGSLFRTWAPLSRTLWYRSTSSLRAVLIIGLRFATPLKDPLKDHSSLRIRSCPIQRAWRYVGFGTSTPFNSLAQA